MSDFTLEVLGNRAILDNLDALEATAIERVFAAMDGAAETGQQTAEDLAAVRTGYMKSQVYTEVRKEVPQAEIILGDDANYAVYVELGTHKMRAQPFLIPGGVAMGEDLKKRVEGLI